MTIAIVAKKCALGVKRTFPGLEISIKRNILYSHKTFSITIKVVLKKGINENFCLDKKKKKTTFIVDHWKKFAFLHFNLVQWLGKRKKVARWVIYLSSS